MRSVILVLALLAAPARANPASDRAAAEAVQRAEGRDYLGSAAKFREAYAADPLPELICNIGVAYHKAQDLPRAQLYLAHCLERGKSLEAGFLDLVRATLAEIETALRAGDYTPVELALTPPTAAFSIDTFAPGETIEGGRTVWLAFGTHRITARADGYVEQTVDAPARDRSRATIAIALRRPQAAARRDRPSVLPPIATTLAAVGFVALAVVASGKAHDHADQAGLALDDYGYSTESDAVTSWNRVVGLSIGLSAAAAVASGYLWYRVVRAPVRVEASPGGVAIAVGGRF